MSAVHKHLDASLTSMTRRFRELRNDRTISHLHDRPHISKLSLTGRWVRAWLYGNDFTVHSLIEVDLIL